MGDGEAPYDCDVSIRDQLERAKVLGLDAIFVTNHNTLDGYHQLSEYKNNHEKFKNINVFPAEEITTDKYIAKHYPNAKWFLNFLLKIYNSNQNSRLWSLFYNVAICLMKRISKKINFQNMDPTFANDRNLFTMFRMAL